GQGFTARLESGFTEGAVGVGLDAIGELGIKLDSSRDRRGTGLLAYGAESLEPEDTYSELGLAAKVRLSKTVLKVGTLQPQLPVAAYNDTRLLSSTYAGSLLTSQEIAGLTVNAGRLEKINQRDSSSNDEMNYSGVDSAHLDLVGGTYALSPTLALSYYYAQMDNIYQQHYAGLVHNATLAEGVTLKTDLRYFDTGEQGDQRFRSAARVDAGRIDNRFFNGMVTLGVGAHKVGVGYQNLSGEGDFAFPGLDPYSVNLVTVNTFTKAETDAWQARYDYDFAALGVPGLAFMTRYVNGRNIETARVSGGKEWERDSDLVYVFQSGTFKGFNVRLRNATFRSSGGLTSDIDENRIIIGYTLPLM
ncbi:MAG: OprD family porin, partial [Pseudomonas sp.]